MNNILIYCVIAGAAAGALFAVNTFMGMRKTDTAAVGQAKASPQTITSEKAKEMIDEGGVIVLDVRTDAEFDEGHIDGAMLIPDTEIAELAPEMLPDKSQTILVHCRTGIRSAKASAELAEMGYTSVYDFGGIVDWKYDIVKSDSAD